MGDTLKHASPVQAYLSRLSAGSRKSILHALNAMARMASDGGQDAFSLQWERLRYSHTTYIRSQLIERYAPATCNKSLAALRMVLKECWRMGLMAENEYRMAVDVAVVPGTDELHGRALTRGEVAALFETCAGESNSNARDAAMIAVMLAAAPRRSELVALDVADYDAAQGVLRIGHGKGNTYRTIYMATAAQDALNAWLTRRGRYAGAIFTPINKADRIIHQRLGVEAVFKMTAKLAERAGIDRFSPHDLRRTCITNLLDAGADLHVVKEIAGHAWLATTLLYDRRGEAPKQRAALLIDVPYKKVAQTT